MWVYLVNDLDNGKLLKVCASQYQADQYVASDECKGINTQIKPEPVLDDKHALAHRITLAMEQFDPYDFADTGYTIEEADYQNLRLLEEEPTEIIRGLLDAMEELMA